MPTLDTFGQGVNIAALGDAPDAQQLASNLANGIIPLSVMRFDSATHRGTVLASPAEGMVTYLRDAKRIDFYDGTTWRTLAEWGPYTPVWTGLTALGASVSRGRYSRVGRSVDVIVSLEWGLSSVLGTAGIFVSLPSTAASVTGIQAWQGAGHHRDPSFGIWRPMLCVVASGASTAVVFGQRTSDLGYVEPGVAGFNWAAGAAMVLQVRYEAASA